MSELKSLQSDVVLLLIDPNNMLEIFNDLKLRNVYC